MSEDRDFIWKWNTLNNPGLQWKWSMGDIYQSHITLNTDISPPAGDACAHTNDIRKSFVHLPVF